MNPSNHIERYSGVTLHEGKWLVKLRYRGKDVTIGHFPYEYPEDAAQAADFARYILWGLNPERWHHNAAKPNFPPGHCWGLLRSIILRRLAAAEVVPVEVILQHLAEHDAAVAQQPAPRRIAEFHSARLGVVDFA